nr:immunoglobulin heavy chain junction region [Mus musculus]
CARKGWSNYFFPFDYW